MYKLHEGSSYIEKTPGYFIPINSENIDYQQFIQDVAEQGIEIVEGPDIVEPDYATLRVQEYPSLHDQEDMKYWDEINGTTVWRDTITDIKEKYPKTITGGTTTGEVPAWVQEAADNWTFNKQLREYIDAVERLDQYILLEGRPKLTETVVVGTKEIVNQETGEITTVDITEEHIIQTAIQHLPEYIEVSTDQGTTETIRNPLVVKDEEERSKAQEIIDNTPTAVIEAVESL